jgi:hypothetical protein
VPKRSPWKAAEDFSKSAAWLRPLGRPFEDWRRSVAYTARSLSLIVKFMLQVSPKRVVATGRRRKRSSREPVFTLRVLESPPMQTFRADARRPPLGRWVDGHTDAWGLGER